MMGKKGISIAIDGPAGSERVRPFAERRRHWACFMLTPRNVPRYPQSPAGKDLLDDGEAD